MVCVKRRSSRVRLSLLALCLYFNTNGEQNHPSCGIQKDAPSSQDLVYGRRLVGEWPRSVAGNVAVGNFGS